MSVDVLLCMYLVVCFPFGGKEMEEGKKGKKRKGKKEKEESRGGNLNRD